jgi:hypothetical protein
MSNTHATPAPVSNVTGLQSFISQDRLAAKAMADYERLLGKTVLVNRVKIIANGRVDYLRLSTPAIVRVLKTRRSRVEYFSCKDLVVPEWTVELVVAHPQIPKSATVMAHPRSYGGDGQTYPGDVMGPGDQYPVGAASSFTLRLLASLRFVPTALAELVHA